MRVKKAGCILINKENKKIGLVYRKTRNDFSFPKGHLEEGETLQECAIRETTEETGRNCHLISEKEIEILYYQSSEGENVENYYYLALDDGQTDKQIKEEDKECLVWKLLDEVEDTLTYQDLKEFWSRTRDKVKEIINDK